MTQKPELGTCDTTKLVDSTAGVLMHNKPHQQLQTCRGWQALPPSQEGTARPKSSQASWSELFVVETESGEWFDAMGEGGWSCFSTRAEAQDVVDEENDEPCHVVRFVRAAAVSAPPSDLIHQVGKLAEREGEAWRLAHAELMDAYEASVSAPEPDAREAFEKWARHYFGLPKEQSFPMIMSGGAGRTVIHHIESAWAAWQSSRKGGR